MVDTLGDPIRSKADFLHGFDAAFAKLLSPLVYNLLAHPAIHAGSV